MGRPWLQHNLLTHKLSFPNKIKVQQHLSHRNVVKIKDKNPLEHLVHCLHTVSLPPLSSVIVVITSSVIVDIIVVITTLGHRFKNHQGRFCVHFLTIRNLFKKFKHIPLPLKKKKSPQINWNSQKTFTLHLVPSLLAVELCTGGRCREIS